MKKETQTSKEKVKECCDGGLCNNKITLFPSVPS